MQIAVYLLALSLSVSRFLTVAFQSRFFDITRYFKYAQPILVLLPFIAIFAYQYATNTSCHFLVLTYMIGVVGEQAVNSPELAGFLVFQQIIRIFTMAITCISFALDIATYWLLRKSQKKFKKTRGAEVRLLQQMLLNHIYGLSATVAGVACSSFFYDTYTYRKLLLFIPTTLLPLFLNVLAGLMSVLFLRSGSKTPTVENTQDSMVTGAFYCCIRPRVIIVQQSISRSQRS
ncbi:unnamed protein product, partial [Mesorhabditis spiculigera]